MPLVLAIENDRTQATRVAALAPSRIDAEIVIVHSVDAALEMLDAAVPDLILTPPLFSPKDDAALTATLRALDSRGVHLQTLVTPVLGSGDAQPASPDRNGGLLNRIRKAKHARSAADGCDPSVFAAQINEYLARSAAERRDREEALGQDQWSSPRVMASAPMLGELLPPAVEHASTAPEPLPSFDEIAIDASAPELVQATAEIDASLNAPALDDSRAELAVDAQPVVGPADAADVSTADWEDLEPDLEDLQLGEALPVFESVTGSDEDEPNVIELPPPDELWASLDGVGHHAMAPLEGPSMQRRRPVPPVKTPKARRADTGRVQPASRRRPKRPTPPTKPMQDEWGLYDPEQCGFSALLERLQQLAETQAEEKEQDRRSGIMRR